MTPMTMLPLVGVVRATVGGVVSKPPACVTLNVWPAMFNVPLRELVLVLAVTDHVTVPEPEPLGGVQVSQLALLLDVHVQPAPAVTLMLPLPPDAAAEAPVGLMA